MPSIIIAGGARMIKLSSFAAQNATAARIATTSQSAASQAASGPVRPKFKPVSQPAFSENCPGFPPDATAPG
jgi:hypothetical protein